MSTMAQSPRSLFIAGSVDALPLVLAAAPVAIIYGALALANGLSAEATLGMSLFVFAGSSQFIAASLVGTDLSIWVIILTTFVVNLRHALYSTHLMGHFAHLPTAKRAPLAFIMTDEAFATTVNRLNQAGSQGLLSYYTGAALCLYVLWAIFTALGIFAGQAIPSLGDWGLEVAMAVAFTGVVVASLSDRAQWACAATAGVCMCFTYSWPNQLGLLFSAFVAIGVGMLLTRRNAA